ncbi:L,D-transpeptidase family protein [Niveibacterium sp. SC-1]|uniref:L,D-transpeptidase family protein n=1 Tax=Niveibacterium sp. SC-1 TaxID=3135646 RepID=UPI00311F0A1B
MGRVLRPLMLAGALVAVLASTPLSAQRIKGPVSDGGPEASLAKIFDAIEQRKLDEALDRTDSLIKIYPNFRLAYLIRGDLLLARSQPLKDFGAAPGAPRERVADLQAEAIARLRAYRDKPQVNTMPRYLMQMRPEQKRAIVVDTQRARLYVYANDNGTPRFLADYYISYGKEGTDKSREGDRKTPVGVYHVVSSLPRKKLPDFYGSGAFPLNYPNEYDKLQGREGHGIWLHGVPSDTLARPPKASDGCVVLANQDLDAVASHLQVGMTPVIISDKVEWLSLDDWNKQRTSLLKEIDAWRQDWQSGDTERYLKHYARDFKSDNATRKQWAAYKRAVASDKQWVKVEISKLGMFRSPGKQEMVVVTFEQDYRSNNHQEVAQKRQYWIKEEGRWKIAYEGLA